MVEIKFAKGHPDAKIPTKRIEDAGYDIYAAFDEDYIEIDSNETKLIPTGICSAFDSDYVMVLKERGSTGTKGIGQRSGIIDSGYRNFWFVPVTNHNNKRLIISKFSKEDFLEKVIKTKINYEECKEYYDFYMENVIFYPYEKAIAQALLLPVPKSTSVEISVEELQSIPSERGMGALGSSSK